MRFTKKIVERGSLTLPSDIREALGIEDGDFVEFEIVGVLKKGDPVPVHDLNQIPLRKPTSRVRVQASTGRAPRLNEAQAPNPEEDLQ